MSLSKHTSAPWRIEGTTRAVNGEPGFIISHGVNDHGDGPKGYVMRAMGIKREDAYLVVAAPVLMKALSEIVDFCDDPDGAESGESLALGLARLLPLARIAVAMVNVPPLVKL